MHRRTENDRCIQLSVSLFILEKHNLKRIHVHWRKYGVAPLIGIKHATAKKKANTTGGETILLFRHLENV